MSRNRKSAKILHGRFTAMPHYMLDCPAYKALRPLACCIYWHLHRLADIDGKRNGAVFYSVRDAAKDFGVNKDTVTKAYDQLQAKGFIVPEELGYLGIEGQGKATKWRLTHFCSAQGRPPTKDFLKWSPGNDFPVAKKQKPVQNNRTPLSETTGQSAKKST